MKYAIQKHYKQLMGLCSQSYCFCAQSTGALCLQAETPEASLSQLISNLCIQCLNATCFYCKSSGTYVHLSVLNVMFIMTQLIGTVLFLPVIDSLVQCYLSLYLLSILGQILNTCFTVVKFHKSLFSSCKNLKYEL